MAETGLRLDKFLCYVRVVKTRGVAADLVEEGHLRIDGRIVQRGHVPVRIGNVLSFALHGRVRILRVLALPVRRGPPAEAQACYEDLSPPPVTAAGNPAPEMPPAYPGLPPT
jgi:ribosome-associated heat shock protein Hsp15